MWIPWKLYERMVIDLHDARAANLRYVARVASHERAYAMLNARVAALDVERRQDRGHHEDVCETFENLRGELTEKTARVASLTAHVEWLSQHVNRLEAERTALLAKLGVGVATPQIEFDPRAFGTPASQGAPILARDESVERGTPEDSIPAAVHQGVSFEDMGDEVAAHEGVRHLDDGTVEYTR